MSIDTYIKTVYQLPCIIADLVCMQRPKVLGTYNYDMRKRLIDIYSKGMYQNLITMSEKENIYVNTVEVTSEFPIHHIINFVGIEPKLEEEQFRKPRSRTISSFVTYPSEINSMRDNLIIFGNSLLRAHFNIDTLPSLEEYDWIFMKSLPNDSISACTFKSNNDLIVFNVVKDLIELYKTLNTRYISFFNHANLKHNVVSYLNEYNYIICALTMATMEAIYMKITNIDQNLIYQINDFEKHSETNKFHIAMRKILRCIILTEYSHDFSIVNKLVYQTESIRLMRIITKLSTYFVDYTRNNDFLVQVSDIIGIIEEEKGEDSIGNY